MTFIKGGLCHAHCHLKYARNLSFKQAHYWDGCVVGGSVEKEWGGFGEDFSRFTSLGHLPVAFT